MGSERPDAEIVRRLYAAFAAGDIATVRECFTDDAVWHLPGRSPVSGDYRGVDSILQDFLATIRERSNGTFKVELLDVLVGSEKIATLQRTTGQRDGKQLDLLACQLITLRDGKIADVRGFQADQYALDEFWS